ncbi:Protein of unknown function [Gryllus bimaculatus]|nr:Protein of unknown function [Gryllus bimaculatus]
MGVIGPWGSRTSNSCRTSTGAFVRTQENLGRPLITLRKGRPLPFPSFPTLIQLADVFCYSILMRYKEVAIKLMTCSSLYRHSANFTYSLR